MWSKLKFSNFHILFRKRTVMLFALDLTDSSVLVKMLILATHIKYECINSK